MLEIRCPKCEGEIKGMSRDYISWRSDRRRCPKCGAEIVLSNSFICYAPCALIFGGLFTLMMIKFGGSGVVWAGLVGIILVLWAILPVVVRVLGRWRVAEDRSSEKSAAWSKAALFSKIILLLAIGVAFVSFALEYRHMVGTGADIESDSYSREGIRMVVTPITMISGGVGVIMLGVYIFARAMSWKAGISAKQRELAEGFIKEGGQGRAG